MGILETMVMTEAVVGNSLSSTAPPGVFNLGYRGVGISDKLKPLWIDSLKLCSQVNHWPIL